MLCKASAPGRAYQFKISLKDNKPRIWRRVEVVYDITLACPFCGAFAEVVFAVLDSSPVQCRIRAFEQAFAR